MLRRLEIDVPSQMSIVGFEPPLIATRTQNMTRVEVQFSELGRRGAALLHGLSTGKSDGESIEVKVMPPLIEGWSTAPVRQ